MSRLFVALLCVLSLAVRLPAQNLTGGTDSDRDDFRYGQGSARGGSLTIKGLEDLGPGATDQFFEVELGNEDMTRREAIIQMLRNLFLGYVERDISRFYKALAPDALFGAGIARNAVLEDFKRLANVNIDVEVTEYRYTLNTTCVKFRWRRVSTDVELGQPNVLDGVSQFCGDRSSGFQFQRIVGVPPFGQSYPEFLQQVQAGQPGEAGPTGPMGTTLALGFTQGNGATIDFDSGTATLWEGDPTVPPGADLTITWPGGGAQCPFGCVQGGGFLRVGGATQGVNVDTNMFFEAQGDAGVQTCNAATPGFGKVGATGGDATFGAFVSANPSERPHIGVRTTAGRYVLVALDLPASITYIVGDTPQVIPGVAEVCNTEPPRGR